MSRVRPALAVLLLVVASVTAGLAAGGSVSAPAAPVEPGDDPVVGVSENSTRVLLLTNADSAAFATPSASVTNALESGYASLDNVYDQRRIEARLEAAANRSQRVAILQNATDRAAERIAAMRGRERRVRAEFAAGDVSAAEYLVTLGTLHAQATSLRHYLGQPSSRDTLYAYAGIDDTVRTRISRLRARLATLRGPVRAQIADVVRGDAESVRVHVTVGNGLMVSTLSNGRYVRETYRPDNVDAAIAADFPKTQRLIPSLYPWLWNNTGGGSTTFLEGFARQYSTPHDHGRLLTYVDLTTERVYLERQWKMLSQTPVTYEYTASANNTTLLVSRTYAGGPVNVRVENATGAPLDAAVTLNGTALGETGADGELWALSPAGEYPVRVVSGDVRLAVNVTARPAP